MTRSSSDTKRSCVQMCGVTATLGALEAISRSEAFGFNWDPPRQSGLGPRSARGRDPARTQIFHLTLPAASPVCQKRCSMRKAMTTGTIATSDPTITRRRSSGAR